MSSCTAGDEPSLDEEISRLTGVPLDVVAAILNEALGNHLHRFRRCSLYTFDAATPEDLAVLSQSSGEPVIVARVLVAISDVAEDWIPNEVADGEA